MLPKILIVDDEEATRSLHRSAFEKAGYEVLEATNGAECLIQVREQSPDLIVMDLNMPHMGGMGALHAIKHHTATKQIPVIIVSGDGSKDCLRLVKEFGANDFLAKPFSVTTLISRVKNQLTEMDYQQVRVTLLEVGAKDESLSLLASVTGEIAWDVYLGKFGALDTRVMVIRGQAPSEASRLLENDAITQVRILAHVGNGWKLLWPAEVSPARSFSSWVRCDKEVQ